LPRDITPFIKLITLLKKRSDEVVEMAPGVRNPVLQYSNIPILQVYIMNSLTLDYLKQLSFTAKQASTLQKIGEYRGKQSLFSRQTPEILNSLKHIAVIQSSESSNRIEGVTAPHERVEALVKNADTPHNRPEQEIAGYRDVLGLLHEKARYLDFSATTILDMHSKMCRYMPEGGGKWKKRDNEILELNSDGSFKRVRFNPTPASETPKAIDTMVDNYHEAIDSYQAEPLVIIPLTVLDFLCIHPFTDGNGRMARLITLQLLYHFDYQVGRYISLERIFEESKETYYETLEKSSKNWHDGKHNSFPWITYFWGVLLRAYSEFEERVGEIRKGKGSKTEQIIKAVEQKLGPFSISDIQKDCPLTSRDMIRLVLRQLRDDGKIEAKGKGRGAKWKKITIPL